MNLVSIKASNFLRLETVDESGTVGVYIEDGNVAAVNGVPAEGAHP